MKTILWVKLEQIIQHQQIKYNKPVHMFILLFLNLTPLKIKKNVSRQKIECAMHCLSQI